MIWLGHVGNTERRETCRLTVGKLEAETQSEDLGVDGIILKWILKIEEGADWTYLARGRTKRVGWRLLTWQIQGKVIVVKLVMKETKADLDTKVIVINNGTGTGQYFQKG